MESTVRLSLTAIVWVLIAEVPARLLQRLEAVRAQLSVRARTDALTGLSNRHDLPHALDALLPGDAVVLLDLDHFKAFNDERGHQAGDAVLVRFGLLLEQSVRASDLAFRYGGEEFLLLLGHTPPVDAEGLVKRTAARWAEESELTFSAGIAVVDADGDAHQALTQADTAPYAAKGAGRNTSRVFEPR